MSDTPVNIRIPDEIREVVEENRAHHSRSFIFKCLMIIGANALYKTNLPLPRKAGGLMVDLEDPETKKRLRNHARAMRKALEEKQKKAAPRGQPANE